MPLLLQIRRSRCFEVQQSAFDRVLDSDLDQPIFIIHLSYLLVLQTVFNVSALCWRLPIDGGYAMRVLANAASRASLMMKISDDPGVHCRVLRSRATLAMLKERLCVSMAHGWRHGCVWTICACNESVSDMSLSYLSFQCSH